MVGYSKVQDMYPFRDSLRIWVSEKGNSILFYTIKVSREAFVSPDHPTPVTTSIPTIPLHGSPSIKSTNVYSSCDAM